MPKTRVMVSGLLALMACSFTFAQQVAVRLNIEAQPLDKALNVWADQTGYQVLIPVERAARGRTAPIVKGTYTPEGALRVLLASTDLKYQFVSERTVTIRAAEAETASQEKRTAEVPGEAKAEGRERPLALAQSRPRETEAVAAENTADRAQRNQPTNKEAIEEVLVTAQKRSERLMDVPAAITAMSGDRLESEGVTSLSDVANYIPGLSMQNGGAPGARTIVIRGISSGYAPQLGAPLAATYIDDAPVGASSLVRGAQFGLDLMPYDLDRIEVLRGPQGTLWGSGAMGGLVRYVLRKPDLTGFEARIGVDTEYVDSSGEPSWVARGAVNVPLVADKLGLRMSGYHRKIPGFTDNVGVDVKNSDHSTQSGGRITMFWNATDSLSVQGTFMAQDVDAADRTGVSLDIVTLKPVFDNYSRFTNFLEPFAQKNRFASVDIDWNLGFASLTSSSSWSRLTSTFTTELPVLGQFTPGNPDALAYSAIKDRISKYTEEVRLGSPETQRFEWMLGGIFTRETPIEDYTLPTFTPSRQPLPYNLYHITNDDARFAERAVFGNVTYKLTERFDIGGGLRYAENEERRSFVATGIFGTVVDQNRPMQRVPTQWMANARFHLDQDKMVYLRAATGYRPGGGCTGCGNPSLEMPDFFQSDDITNYEAGFKGQFFEHRLQLDLAAFYIDWKGIQGTVISPKGGGYIGNGETASSRGVELASAYQIADGLRLNATLAYTDAHLTADSPGLFGLNGDQLPVTPSWTGSVTADYRRALNESLSLVLGGGYRYRDKIYNQFTNGTGGRFPLGPQNILDTYVGLDKNKVTARLYARNIFNDHSYTGLLLWNGGNPAAVPIQPRTIGLSVDYRF